MRELLNNLFVLLLVTSIGASAFFVPTHAVAAESGDVGLVYSHFRFSQVPLVTGQQVRLYAAVKNNGDIDMSGEVSFSLPGGMIKQPVPFTSVADGAFEEIWIDFTVPEDPFNLYVQVWVNDDSDPSNNTYFSPRYEPLADRDRDSIPDEQDNCSGRTNQYQEDEDGDGVGDACDEVVAIAEPTSEPDPISDPGDQPVSSAPPAQPLSQPLQLNQSRGGDNAVTSVSGDASAAEPSTSPVLDEVSNIEQPQGNVIVSPNARFSYERVGWNVYVFSAWQPQLGAVYTWETSDGRTHDGSEATFHFRTSGAYKVKLTTSQSDGTFVSEEVTVHTSFFHLQNPWLASLIAGLLVLCGVILWQGMRRPSAEVTE